MLYRIEYKTQTQYIIMVPLHNLKNTAKAISTYTHLRLRTICFKVIPVVKILVNVKINNNRHHTRVRWPLYEMFLSISDINQLHYTLLYFTTDICLKTAFFCSCLNYDVNISFLKYHHAYT